MSLSFANKRQSARSSVIVVMQQAQGSAARDLKFMRCDRFERGCGAKLPKFCELVCIFESRSKVQHHRACPVMVWREVLPQYFHQ